MPTTDPADKAIEARMASAASSYPGFKVVPKADSLFMKVIYYVSFMFIWNSTFMTSYITTIGLTIYTPDPFKGPRGLAILEHELQHIADARALPRPLWSLGYLFPQCLALLALLAFWSPWWLLALLALGPWPAPFRVNAEFRAYRKQLIVLRNNGIHVSSSNVDALKETFCGWRYFRMSWSWEGLRRRFMQVIDPMAVFRD